MKPYLKKQDTIFEIIRIQNRITLKSPKLLKCQEILQLSYNYTEFCKFHSITFKQLMRKLSELEIKQPW